MGNSRYFENKAKLEFVSNREQDDVHNFIKDKQGVAKVNQTNFEALCFSTPCGRPTRGAVKQAKRFEVLCPDCSHALYWKKTYKGVLTK